MRLKTRRTDGPEVSSGSVISSESDHPDKGLPVWPIVAAFAAIRLVLALHYPLSEDESYYWDWSRNLDWGYYDQGPMIAWWIRGLCSILGDNALGVRVGAIMAGAATQLVAYATVRRLFGPREAMWGVLVLSVTPLAFVGGFVFTYDALMILFWALAIYGAVEALQGRAWGWAVWGAALGFGLLSKLSMGLILPCALVLAVLVPKAREALARPWPWVATAGGIAMLVPNLVWQAGHDWVTLEHVRSISRASQGKAFYVRTGDFVASQLAVVTPILAVGLAIVLVAAWRKRADGRVASLWAFGAPVLLFFLVSTLWGKVLGNWAAAGWYSTCLLGGVWIVRVATKRLKAWLVAGVATSAILSLVAVFPEILALAGVKLPESVTRPSNRMFGGPELARAVSDVLSKEPGLIVAGTEYQQVSRLGFYLPGQPRVLCLFPSTRLNDYLLRQSSDALPEGQDVLVVTEMKLRANERAKLLEGFASVDEEVTEVPIYRRQVLDEPVRTYYLYRFRGFRPGSGSELLKPTEARR